MIPEFLNLPDRKLAFQRSRGRSPGVIFLGGYASDMTGTKASFLSDRCEKQGIAFLRFDYRGHGQSSGNFKDGTIGAWFEDSRAVFDELTEGAQILIGSSMGGWLALMLARERHTRVKALIGIAAAPDFTEDLILPVLSDKQRAELDRDGVTYDETAPENERAPLTKKLLDEAKSHLLLRGPLAVTCPVRLLQGKKDTEVPWQYAQRIADAIPHKNVKVTLVENGDHRLSQPQDLELLWKIVSEFL